MNGLRACVGEDSRLALDIYWCFSRKKCALYNESETLYKYKAVLRACALYAGSCSGISPGGLKWFPCVQAC